MSKNKMGLKEINDCMSKRDLVFFVEEKVNYHLILDREA